MRARLGLALACVAGALALGACGSSGGGDTSTSAGTPPDTTSTTLPHVTVETAAPNFDAASIYRTASPGVVTITSVFGGSSTASILGGGAQAAIGAGFVLSDDGYIATNAHVVTDVDLSGGSGAVHEATQLYVQFSDRNRVAASVVGYDLNDDVALIKVDPDGLDLQPLELATDEKLEVGQPVAAIGSPFEQNESLSVGVVSALDRTLDSFTKYKIEGGIQTDASINPGNSGGPLLDANGRVVGINRQISSSNGANQGVAFAIPIDLADRSLQQLKDSGKVTYAYIGIRSGALYPQLAEQLNLPVQSGTLVSSVVPGGPADKAGIRGHEPGSSIHFQGGDFPTGGDVIIAINGQKIVTSSDLPTAISKLNPGDVAHLEIIRDGKQQSVDVTLGTRPDAGS